MSRSFRAIFLLAAAVILPTECFCVASALETQGEVMQALLRLLLWTNILWVLLFWWVPRVALVGLLASGLLIVPYQVVLLDRLSRLNVETMRFVDSRLRLRAEGKPIPSKLDDYNFSDPQIKKFIYDYSVDEEGREFFISFFVVEPGITHSYSSKSGWFYYPD